MHATSTAGRPGGRLTFVLWTVQGLLALVFAFAGGMKLLVPIDTLLEQMPVQLVLDTHLVGMELLACTAPAGLQASSVGVHVAVAQPSPYASKATPSSSSRRMPPSPRDRSMFRGTGRNVARPGYS